MHEFFGRPHKQPSMLGPIRTVNPGPFLNGKAEAVAGDTHLAVIEFSNPVKAEALLGYGNWSSIGSKHVDDQLTLMSTGWLDQSFRWQVSGWMGSLERLAHL
jgi:acyl-homoserine-lactone acylase